MTDLKFFMGLFTLISSAEEEMGISNLSDKDKLVLQAFWDHKDENNSFDITYEKFCQLIGTKTVSRSQYFKSIQKLIDADLICKLGSVRSHKFKFLM